MGGCGQRRPRRLSKADTRNKACDRKTAKKLTTLHVCSFDADVKKLSRPFEKSNGALLDISQSPRDRA